MSENARGDGWCWPMQGSHDIGRVGEIRHIISPYQLDPPPICFPGALLDPSLMGLAPDILWKQLNAIGTHTRGRNEKDDAEISSAEAGFETIQRMERAAVWMVASMLGGTPADTDGYFCGGGTEGNHMGMWIGREFLNDWMEKKRLQGDPQPSLQGIAVLCTPMVHYSIFKSLNQLDILCRFNWRQCDHSTPCGWKHLPPKSGSERLFLVGTDEAGRMDLPSLQMTFDQAYTAGYRSFLVVGTVGTCLTGSVDPIEEMSRLMERMEQTYQVCFYFHVDAAFGGFTVPFLEGSPRIGFDVPRVRSMVVDAHKMGHLPYPAGIFLCRKNLQDNIGMDVAYISGHRDDTFCGSRPSLAPILAYEYYPFLGVEGQRAYVQACIEARDRLLVMIQKCFGADSTVVRPLPCSPWTNFLPLEIRIENGAVPNFLKNNDPASRAKRIEFRRTAHLAPWQLRSDGVPSISGHPMSCPRIAYKLCIMPQHTIPFLKQFVDQLERVVREAGLFGK